MKTALALAAITAFVVPAEGSGQEVYANLRLQLGVADSDYPGCHGRMLAFIGGSVEVGQPFFLEVLGEMMGVGGDDCLPGRPSSDPNEGFTSAVITEPRARVGIGVGRRYADQRVSVVARTGTFISTSEPFVASNVFLRLYVFTVGFELGTVYARWEFEDGTTERLWSTFRGVSLGLRF